MKHKESYSPRQIAKYVRYFIKAKRVSDSIRTVAFRSDEGRNRVLDEFIEDLDMYMMKVPLNVRRALKSHIDEEALRKECTDMRVTRFPHYLF